MAMRRSVLGPVTAVLVAAMLAAAAVESAAQFESTNPAHDVDLGRQVAREVERMMPLSTDRAAQERVKRIGSAISDQIEPKLYPYEFRVLAVSDFNAFCLPGGFIYVYEGVLARVKDDNALAFILAHEAVHAARRHWASRIENQKGLSMLGSLVTARFGLGAGLLASLTNVLIAAKYSRSNEREADAGAMEYLWKAGYDLEGGTSAMQVLVNLEKGRSVPRYLRNHPPAPDRMGRVKQAVASLSAKGRPQAPAAPSLSEADARLAAIAGDLTGLTLAPNPWFPLAVGNEWTYTVQSRGAKSSYRLRITGAIPIGKQAVYTAETALSAKSTVACQLLTTAGEVWRRPRPSVTSSVWQLEHLTDLPEGAVPPRGSSDYSLEGTESISVPCGSFSGVRHIRKQVLAPPQTVDLWFAQGVGLIRRFCAETGVTETLTAYRLVASALEPDTGAVAGRQP